ncbi:cytochrome b-c1 complex subunit 2, mitochondrial [Anabrus simplex]|uniref:cytochrome b-c1 complex subunit 2, mitochondrial n=1 Tax=Anabrus simplex TaxID=316456 RepID=UPI0035A2B719
MTSNALKWPLLRAVAVRSYAAQAAVNPSSCASHSLDVKTTVLPNKLVVASLESSSPVSRVSIVFRAGSRYEQPDSLGASHILRIAGGLTTSDSTQFGITRNVQQVGGNLNVTGDRETVAYTLEVKRDSLDSTLKFLEDAATKQMFKPWELSDNVPRLKFELAALPPTVQLLELLHKAAYKSGLGNSLFIPDYLIGKISSETMQHYVQSTFLTNRAAVVGVGVDHDELVACARNLCLESGEGPQSSSKFRNGEIRQDTGSQLAHVAVATEGASIQKPEEALAFAVLQYALGVGPSVKWGSQSSSPLGKALARCDLGGFPYAVSALNINYTDSGLFGFVASSPANVASVVVLTALKQMRAGLVSEADVTRGKMQLKAAIMMGLESGSDLVHEMGCQAALVGNVLSGSSLANAVDKVTAAQVNAAAKKVATGKLCMASVGKLSCVPYLDELK